MFKKAEKKEAKLRLNINGPSGSGKTWTSLEVAKHIVNGGRTALIDTEHGSASKYSDVFDFDTVELVPPFHPERYIEAIDAAGQAGYDVLIIDSLSHGWAGPGGVLELKDDFSRQQKYNDYTAWGPAGKLQDELVEAILGAPMHVIATMRSKMKHAMEQVEQGGRTRTIVKKIGLEPIQRGGICYEFDVVADMDTENVMVISKTRCSELTGKVFHKPGAELAEILERWLVGVPMTEDDIFEREIEALEWAEFGERAAAEFDTTTDRVKEILNDLDAKWWATYKYRKMVCWRYLRDAPVPA